MLPSDFELVVIDLYRDRCRFSRLPFNPGLLAKGFTDKRD